MSFGSGGFGGFGQQNQQNQQNQQASGGFGGFGSTATNTSGTGFGSSATNAFGSNTSNPTTGGSLFGSSSGGGGFGSTGGAFGSTNNTAFGAKPAFGSTTSGGGGLFGSTTATAGTSGFGGGAFGSNTASTSTPFGGGGTSLFGGNKPATTFGSGTAANTGGSLFGSGSTGGGFGGGTSGFGATSNPGLGTNVGDPPGTAQVQFQPTVEKETSNPSQSNSFQNILFMEPYKKWSADELRLADYNQGRRHGNASGTGAFGVSSGFGSGGFGSTGTTGFGGTNATSTTGTGMFGSTNNQTTTSGFGQSATTGTGFGSTAGGGMFGTQKPATTGSSLFGSTAAQPQQGGGLFGSASTGGGFGTTANNSAFGSGAASGTGGSSLFGGGATQNKPASSFNFGTGGAQTGSAFGGTGTTGGFGAAGTNPASTGTSLFGNTGQQNTGGGGLFGNAGQTNTGSAFGGGFGAQNQQQQQQQQQQQGGSLFGGQQQQKPAGGLFGNTGTTNTGGGIFGNTSQTSTGFGAAANTQQQSGGLFGNKPAGATGGSLFGSTGNTATGAAGGGLFGNLGGNTQNQQQQPAQQQGGLFNQTQSKPSLFGNSQSTGGGLFGTQTAQPQNSLFGGSMNQQQPQAQNSMFGGSQGVQNTPQSLTTSIADVSAYGTPSLFQGIGAGEVRDPGPLATPLSGSTTKTPRRGSILPLYKLNPGSAQKFVTPQKRGFGFSYSNFGTPTSPSSAASTPGGFGQSLLVGGSRGLSKSISSSSLRRSFNPEDSILAPGAFSATSGPKYYGNTGSVKRLVINREIRSDLFSTPNKDKQQPAELTNGSRRLSKRVSFDTSAAPAIENGSSENQPVEESAQDMGFIRPSSRNGSNVNGSRPSSSDANPEMEQVKGNELAIVHEESSPVATKKAEEPKPTGDYWMRPSPDEIKGMSRSQRQQVVDFTVGRKGVGQVRSKVPVDLTHIDLEDIPGGIVKLETRSATVYPVAASKPPVGKGLNVPSEISLEHSWPRGRAHEKSGPRVSKHIERLKKINNTTFINYDSETGVWTFAVEHFTTYGLDYDEDDTDQDVQADTQERDDLPALPPHPPAQAFASPEPEADDTFDFRKNRRAVPGAFDDAALSDDEEEVRKQPSFLSNGSAEFASHALVPVIAEDEDMDHEDAVSENEDMAISTPRPHLPAEPQEELSPRLGATLAQDTPAGIVRARMRAIKESTTPLKLQVAGGDDWMDMLRRTVSPQKRDRAALRALNEVELNEPAAQERVPVSRNRVVSDGRGFATSIDLMNSLFEKAKAPVQATQAITPAKGFLKWPYKRQAKQPENEADMDPTDRSFHGSFKPSWAPDGAFLMRQNAFTGIGVIKSSAFEGDFPIENPLEGISDHRDLVDIHLVQGIPTVSTQRVPRLDAFSSFRTVAYRNQVDRLDSVSRNIGAYEQSVWELASVLFDPVDSAGSAEEEKRARKINLARFWRSVVLEQFTKNLDRAFTYEEKAIAYLSAHKIAEACKQLGDGKDLKLATLVSLIGTNDAFQKDMREQVEEWHDGDVLSEFTLAIRTIYSLLGGDVTVCKGKKGVGIENRLDTENIAERFGLNWKQAFGLRLWYGISSGDDIAAAVDKFLDDVERGDVPAPQPWYVEQGLQSGWDDHNVGSREDLLWGLLKVYAGRAKLEDILQPENSQLSPFNYRLCWQLSQALGATNKRLFGDKAEAKADALTAAFATEVLYHKKEGSWVAAIWVLLHLSDPTSRAQAVRDVLDRNAAALFAPESKELSYHDRIVEDMKVPAAWFWRAAALHWRSRQGCPSQEARCLLRAQAFGEAHRIFARELAPRAVVAREYGEALAMLARFLPHRHAIADWAGGGEVYAQFLELLADQRGGSGSKQQQEAGTAVPAQLVEALAASLPAMYEACGEGDTLEVAAVTEMADVVAREAMAMAEKGRMDISKISRLPLTEDRHLVYSGGLAAAYYREVMSARG